MVSKTILLKPSGSWTVYPDSVTTLLYDGWNIIAERRGTINRQYFWGVDLSGTFQGAGGIGGLLMMYDSVTNKTYVYTNDANGNVTGLIEPVSGSMAAKYEYGPFGEVLRSSGAMAMVNPFRWSSKYSDNDGGLVYYGYRFYNPQIGRWISRDPIGTRGGTNLQSFVNNNSINRVDVLGLADYEIGDPKEPQMNLDDDFEFDPSASANLGDWGNWAKFGALAYGASKISPSLEDALKAYYHYRDGSGSDLEIDYSKAYRNDSIVKQDVDNEIAAAQKEVEELAKYNLTPFSITGKAVRAHQPASENWQKTIGEHWLWGSAEVACEGNGFKMIIIIREKDRYNFNRNGLDIGSGNPDNANGRFTELGWAKPFNTNGKIKKEVTWEKGKIPKTTKVRDLGRR